MVKHSKNNFNFLEYAVLVFILAKINKHEKYFNIKNYLLLTAILFVSVFAGCKKADISDTAPTSDFVIKNANAELNEGASLMISNNSASSKAVTYLWDFGNGKTSAEKNPVMAYDMHGEYDVKLTVTDDMGRTSTTTKTVTVLCIFASLNHSALF